MMEGDLFHGSSAPEKIDFKAAFLSYLRYWYLFVVSAIICLSIAFLKIRYTLPQYYVNGTILIKEDGNGSGLAGGAALSEIDMFKSTKNIDNEIILLRSKSLMQRVLTELSFNTTYYLSKSVHDVELYGNTNPIKVIVKELYANAYGKSFNLYIKNNTIFQLEELNTAGKSAKQSYKFGQQVTNEYGVFTVLLQPSTASVARDEKIIVKFHDIQNLAEYYSNKLHIAPVNKNTSVLNIGLTDPVWQKSIDILNKLIEVYEKEAVEDKNLIASNTLQFIDERLNYLTAELSDVEKNVELYKKQNDLTDVNSEAQLYLNSASDYNKQLADFEIQIDLLKSIESYLQKQGDQFELVPSSLNIQDPTLVSLISKFNELQLERQRLIRSTQPDNPIVVSINEQLAHLRLNIEENLKNIKNGLIITRQSLLASSARFENKKKQVPVMERELLEINRQQGVKENLYLYLLQKREESALSLAATVSNFRIIDVPRVSYPIGPNKPMLYLIALLVGVGIPFSCLYIKDLLNDKVEQVKDIEKITSTPILGEISHSTIIEPIVVKEARTSPIVEMFRLIRTNLQFATVGKLNKVIMITSTVSGEGKTFFSVNLGASLVLTGKRVIVLGMDLRKPKLLQTLGMPDGLGITNYLISNNIAVDDIVRPCQEVPGLYIIGSGPVPPNPTELMMSSKVEKLIDILKESFDHIIIDTAPIGQVADAFTLREYIDSTIYIVRSNFTSKNQITTADKIYKENKLNHVMIVLNDTKKGNSYGYGYGYTESKQKIEATARRQRIKTKSV